VINRSEEEMKDIRVSGKITNEVGQPLEGVSVHVKGAKTGTTTSATGEFTLDVPEGAVLVISTIGYDPKEVTVNGSEPITINLAPSARSMEDVVVIGYGTSKKTTLTGSVTTVMGKELVQSPATNVSNSLVGRLPGLTAVTGSGEPGYDGSTLRIRGLNTLNNNDVLVASSGSIPTALKALRY
jgi:hypothetical protein